MHQLEQHAVGIAMYDAVNRRMAVIADRISAFAWLCREFVNAGNVLPRDRIVGIIDIDQSGHRRRHRDGVTRRHFFQFVQCRRRHQTMRDQLGRLPQRRGDLQRCGHRAPAGGVHTT
jgi:hypothetical protein